MSINILNKIINDNDSEKNLSELSVDVIDIDNIKSIEEIENTNENYVEMCSIRDLVNKKIGYNWWKRYVAGAFWSNITTPTNLAITLLTAVTTGEAATKNLIPQNASFAITLTTLLISTLNTFFRPHTKMTQNLEIMKKFTEFGNKFEEIHYGTVSKERLTCRNKIIFYKKLLKDINDYKNTETPENQNFLTDMIHLIVRHTCIKNREVWLKI
jgi:hypothetical protein